ncbi:CheR family methyltransferase [Pseudobacteriovorax antillogorgiicola]|uniref:Chemotaxis protein methyltransferase CheR n=1 Tax=Pseudobacteriovorax antillogorgiicola TaxID=1513793 RepID=A0A1Y6BVF0_9BACT|nr:protein-glutamate O-methyltransferase CheR [Pseudobacteriovorax antillogorgiicola]TCS52373.1 chemotaxis protein methyltransferase CheR [Pseudobacteriovorax antillogorgiicola]SMF29337.1 chemotaxis protein methyltransferase CheR [Pseudobacteriovorax antillogorgiicola]
MDINESVLESFSKFIFDRIGIVYTQVNYYQLETRLENAMSHFGFASIDELQRKALILKDDAVIRYILDIATNNETSFFRDAKVFHAIIKEAIKPLAAEPGHKIRIWSAACSTGQEPYSLAMELENLRTIYPQLNYEIFATDFSKRVLDKAQSGLYTQLEVQRGLSSINLVKYFKQSEQSDPTGPLWEISDNIRNRVKFSHFNLLESWNLSGKFDLILCRNVLIYQTPEMKKDILKKLNQYMKPESYLVLGCAESITGLQDMYEPVQFETARFFKKVSNEGEEKKAS